ncbi:MAG: hypothetical protein ACKVON_00480 [Beijerinckiaceae bacterium]
MFRRTLLITAIGLLPALAGLACTGPFVTDARASEAIAAPKPLQLTAETFESDRSTITQWVAREGFTLTGNIRRRGQLVTVSAERRGAPWRLVLDASTGEIIGRKPLAQVATSFE